MVTKLAAYILANGLTQEQFGSRLGVSGATVHRWMKGKVRPSWNNVREIQRVTDGAICAADFVPVAKSRVSV